MRKIVLFIGIIGLILISGCCKGKMVAELIEGDIQRITKDNAIFIDNHPYTICNNEYLENNYLREGDHVIIKYVENSLFCQAHIIKITIKSEIKS